MGTTSTLKIVRERESGSVPIGFRLDAEYYCALAERANQLGISVHALARQYVRQVLQERHERAALYDSTRASQAAIVGVNDNLKIVTKALLMASGRVTEEEAVQWLVENFR